jgi:hypothetical protein
MIEFTSRYYGMETATLILADGREHRYLRRRFIPAPDESGVFSEHVVVQGDRLDNITARYLGAPELFWQLCDANKAMRPVELTETIGRRLWVPSPLGGKVP